MSDLMKWFDRSFSSDLPIWMFPTIVERLRGTPAALEDRVGELSPEVLIRRDGDRWSIQEQTGHLLDLEPLWMSRVEDFLTGRETLQYADLTNRKTHEANHNERQLADILSEFRRARLALVSRLDTFDEEIIARTALHPRLGTPMRVLDHAFFVAEHDIHHFTRITELIRRFAI